MLGDDRKKKKAELARKLAEIDRRLGIESETPERRISLSERSPKFYLILASAVVIGISAVIAIGNQFVLAVREMAQESAVTASATQQAPTTSRYFGPGYVPLFVGGAVETAMILANEKFDEQFWRIRNLDTKKDITTSYREGKPIEKVEGLFVCSQTLAPGADVPDFAIGQITIEVSRDCSQNRAPFLMGPAAEQAGRFVPTPLGENCYRADMCDAPVMEGVFLGFLDEEYKGYKTALIETGVGKMEIELAWIDPVSQAWCEISDENSNELFAGALEARDSLLEVGSLVRLIKGSYWDDSAFLHRLSDFGELVDGEVPANSVNEMLVQTGYWIPTVSEHPWENVLYSYNEEMLNPTWTSIFSELHTWETPILAEYALKLNQAANDAFANPNPHLGTCIEEKSDQVAFLISEKEDEERREEDNRDRWAADVEAVWRSVFCPTMSEKYPDRCASYDPAKDDLVGTGSSSGSGGNSSGGSTWGSAGGGTNCTWVNGYTRRDGTRVSGYRRCG